VSLAFRGWPPEALRWFEGLEADNTREWFHANRATYDEAVRGPLEALLAEVEAEFGEGRVFRPNRDTRFSANKEPYKLNSAAALHRPQGGAYYLSISADGLHVAAGYYMMSRDQLDRFRQAVADERAGPALEPIVEALERAGYDVGYETLKTAPRGYPRDHPRVRFLRHSGLTMSRVHPPRKWLHTAAAKDRVVEAWRAAAPLHEWLDRHVGAPRS
jgi:uncharacterized protein (TIGR02453 family)